MKKSSILDQIRLTAFIVLAFAVFSFQPLSAQCNTPSGVVINVRPDAPLQFQFFPVSLLGVGRSDANLSAFQNFGIQITNTTGSDKDITLEVELTDGSTSMFERNLQVTMTIPNSPTPIFIGVPQLLNPRNLSYKKTGLTPQNPRISDAYIKKLKGGLPSGTFEFRISTSDYPTAPSYCKSIVIQVLAGATVDVIMPANGSTVSSLPQFQWSAVGGQKFKLTLAKLKPNQTQEDALNNSSQRAIIELGSTSYQTTAGGPTGGGGATLIENNLAWNPGLLDGEYCYRVTMVQRDPITGTQNLVNSNIANFTVSGSGGTINTSGLNTDEIIGLLTAAAKGVNIADLLKGYSAFSIEINGTAATVDELRTKLNDISASAKWSIKP
ncbi:hypothetical protein JNM05_06825 [bacterium]|nr:hypothetical protein [bacterium]